MSGVPTPGSIRPGMGVPGMSRPGPVPAAGPVGDRDDDAGTDGSGHPAVDAVLQAMANAVNLPPADQIAQYEAAHRTLRETLATIDQA